MPELPEVEAFKSYLESHCLHHTITQVTVGVPKVLQKVSSEQFQKALAGHQLTNVSRYGKYLVISVSNSPKKLVLHFGMTGSLEFTHTPDSKMRFSAISFTFNNHTSLHYKSVRKFEKVWLVEDIDTIKSIHELGPDVLKLSYDDFVNIVTTHKTRNIKAFLMDQKLIAGLGNEYCDEILFQAGIHPRHTVKDISELQVKKIYKQMHQVLSYFIESSIKNIQKAAHEFPSKKNRLTFKSSYLQAHRHIDMICPKNKKHALKKMTVAGRTTYYCPKDQPS